MELLPNDVRQHRFRASVRGYNREEVDQFLEHVATVLEEALAGRQKAEEAIRRLDKEMRRFREQEGALKQAVVTVQKAMASARDSSREEMEALKRNAHTEALNIVSQAELKRRELEHDLNFLRESRRSYIEQFRAFCTAQLRTLEQMEAEYGSAPAPADYPVAAKPDPVGAEATSESEPSPPEVSPESAAPTPDPSTEAEPAANDPRPWLPPRVSRDGVQPDDEPHSADSEPDLSDSEEDTAAVAFPPPLFPPVREPQGE